MTARRTTVLALTAAALVLTGGAAWAGQDDDPVRYVNLGDSYSAGSGILPFDPAAPPQCTQSTRNWAHDIAGDLGYRLTDVSCGGAKTKDFTESQADGVAPQLDAVTPDTDLVTMTIGGNDENVYGDAYGECIKLGLAAGGHGNPCEQRFGDSFLEKISEKTYPNVVRALQAVQDKAPHARVAISGYLQILPTDGSGCFPVAPFAAGDVPYLNRIQAALNGAVEKAAADTGVTYLDVTEMSEGHDACKLPGTRWVEPLVPINSAPAHPNALGERKMADNAIEKLGLRADGARQS